MFDETEKVENYYILVYHDAFIYELNVQIIQKKSSSWLVGK